MEHIDREVVEQFLSLCKISGNRFYKIIGN